MDHTIIVITITVASMVVMMSVATYQECKKGTALTVTVMRIECHIHTILIMTIVVTRVVRREAAESQVGNKAVVVAVMKFHEVSTPILTLPHGRMKRWMKMTMMLIMMMTSSQ